MTACAAPAEVGFFWTLRVNKLSTDGRAITESPSRACFQLTHGNIGLRGKLEVMRMLPFLREKTQDCKNESLMGVWREM